MHFVEAKGILSQSGGMNVYRGCSHGCIYCDSRSACYNMQHKFEDIEVNVPNDYDKILTKLYGNYMQLPPEDKRFNPAHYKIDFGEY